MKLTTPFVTEQEPVTATATVNPDDALALGTYPLSPTWAEAGAVEFTTMNCCVGNTVHVKLKVAAGKYACDPAWSALTTHLP
jgi:hypothetical protein